MTWSISSKKKDLFLWSQRERTKERVSFFCKTFLTLFFFVCRSPKVPPLSSSEAKLRGQTERPPPTYVWVVRGRSLFLLLLSLSVAPRTPWGHTWPLFWSWEERRLYKFGYPGPLFTESFFSDVSACGSLHVSSKVSFSARKTSFSRGPPSESGEISGGPKKWTEKKYIFPGSSLSSSFFRVVGIHSSVLRRVFSPVVIQIRYVDTKKSGLFIGLSILGSLN